MPLVIVGVAVIGVATGIDEWCLRNLTDLYDSISVSILSIREVNVVIALNKL